MERRFEGVPLGLYMVSLAAFLFGLSEFTIQPIFPLYLLELEATMLQVGIIFSIRSVLMIIMRIPLTLAAQRLGERRMMELAFLIQATTPLFYYLAPDLSWFYLIPAYQIIATGSFNQLAMSLASSMAPRKHQGGALGRFMTFMNLGMFVGPIICGSLVSYIHYRQLFLVSSLFPLMGLVFFHRFTRGVENQSQIIEQSSDFKEPNTLEAFKSVLKDRKIIVLSIIRTTYSMSNTMFRTLYAIYATQQLAFTPSTIALLFSVMGLANTLIKIPAGWITDRLNPRTILLATFGTIILDFIAIAYVRNPFTSALALTVFGVCWGTRAVVEWSVLARTVTPSTRTLAMSYLSIFWGVGSTLGSLVAGIAAEVSPTPTILILAALINLPAITLIHTMKSPKRS